LAAGGSLACRAGRKVTKVQKDTSQASRIVALTWDQLVREAGLHPSADVAAADWVGPRLRRFGSAVAAVVPDGFPAYVRILHPAQGTDDRPVRWAEVAAWSGRRMHRLVQFDAIIRPAVPAPTDPAPWNGQSPPDGNLPAELLRILCPRLAEHTSTAASCWFCLWDGYGWLHGSPSVAIMGRGGSFPVPPAFPAEVLDGPRVRLPGRDYLLFAGPLAAASELGWADPSGFFFSQSPNLFWPHDHAWCVASEIDLFCTLVAGPEALAEALLDDPRLETWRVQPADPIAFDSDQVNT
jgi:hypothetical protein